MSAATATESETGLGRLKARSMAVEGEFEAIYEAFRGRIFGLAYRMMGNVDDAFDVTQETFISAYQHIGQLETDCKHGRSHDSYLTAWLFRIATNKCIDELRRRGRRVWVDWDAYLATSPDPSPESELPEVQAIARERSQRIQRVLDGMSPQYRLALLLHENLGLSVREVAGAMGRTESAVKSLLFRAREQFRGLYELEETLEAA